MEIVFVLSKSSLLSHVCLSLTLGVTVHNYLYSCRPLLLYVIILEKAMSVYTPTTATPIISAYSRRHK